MRVRRRWPMAVAALTAVLVAAGALWLWRDPLGLVRLEFSRQRIAAGLSLRQVEVAGHRWAYAVGEASTPDAPTLVMIHGFTGGKENWYPLARQLRGRYRVLIPDLPGWGQSERTGGADYGFVAQSARLAAFIESVARRPGGHASIAESHAMPSAAHRAASVPSGSASTSLASTTGGACPSRFASRSKNAACRSRAKSSKTAASRLRR